MPLQLFKATVVGAPITLPVPKHLDVQINVLDTPTSYVVAAEYLDT
jgi:hypothetical protein